MKRLVGLSILTLFLTLTGMVSAQTPTRLRSSTQSATPVENVTTIKEKIATQVAVIKNSNKYVVGKIITISAPTITILTDSGRTVSVQTNQTTKITSAINPKKTITFKNLLVGDRIAANGISSEESAGLAKIVYQLPIPNPRTTIVGTVTSVKAATASASINNTNHTVAEVSVKLRTGTTVSVLITDSTKIKVLNVQKLTVDDIKVGQKVIVTGPKTTGAIPANYFFVFREEPLALPNINNEATNSPTPTTRSRSATASTTQR